MHAPFPTDVEAPPKRRFGSLPAHLDVDFLLVNRPRLVSEVLAACEDAQSPPGLADAVNGWTLPRRLQALLRIALDSGEHELELQARCANGDCRADIGIRLELAQFEMQTDECDLETRIDGQTLSLRLPTGSDQLRWLALPVAPDAAGLASDLVRQVNGQPPAPGWRAPPEWIERLADQMAGHDRLTALRVDTVCPDCERAMGLEIDLERQLLSVLASCQRRALEGIHRLASAYHWSERQILGLSPARRAWYLARVDEEGVA